MIVYREKRIRIGDIYGSELFSVRSWYLFGFILLFRRYEQLTAKLTNATPSERGQQS